MPEPVPITINETRRRLEALERQIASEDLRGHGGGGTSDGMDPWKTSVEERLTALREDVREVRNWLAGGMAFLLVSLAGGFIFLLVEISASNKAVNGQLAALKEGQVRIETILAERLPPKP